MRMSMLMSKTTRATCNRHIVQRHLDVLATIELKFALLRERVYVEKMDAPMHGRRCLFKTVMHWSLFLSCQLMYPIHTAAHPELLHLQKELLKRRDKRLELASRKRSYEVANASYEVANAVTRRLADESNTWSWWQVISIIHPLTNSLIDLRIF